MVAQQWFFKECIHLPFISSAMIRVMTILVIAPYSAAASNLDILKRNDLSCNDISALRSAKEKRVTTDITSSQRLFQEYKSGDSIEIKIPAEELLGTVFLSGKYKVGPNSSIRLSDGHILYKQTEQEGIVPLVKAYIKERYGYEYIYVTSSEPPTVDYALRGEVPLQSFLFTERTRSATASSDLQKMGEERNVPNSLSEFLKTRRPFTVYSDMKCLAVIHENGAGIGIYDVEKQVLIGEQGEYVPLYNGDIIYVPQKKLPITAKNAAEFAASPFASDVQISITGWGVKPTIKSSPSGTNLFDMLVTSDSLQRGFSPKLKVYRYDSSMDKYTTTEVSYPKGAQSFYPKDKDIVSVGKDAWSSTLSTINELATPLVTALSSFFFFKGLAGF